MGNCLFALNYSYTNEFTYCIVYRIHTLTIHPLKYVACAGHSPSPNISCNIASTPTWSERFFYAMWFPSYTVLWQSLLAWVLCNDSPPTICAALPNIHILHQQLTNNFWVHTKLCRNLFKTKWNVLLFWRFY